MSEAAYKRLERIIVTIMLLGIVAMFQPWFRNIVELFEPLAPDARLGRTFKNEVAPIILRYGFYATFLSTVAFIVISHYSYEDLQKAVKEKGALLTVLLILLPVLYGFLTIGNLAWAFFTAALLGVFNVTFAIALWNKKLWGLIGLVITAVIELILALSGSASLPMGIALLVIAAILFALVWPKRTSVLQG
ncbi:MAG: hypothetical protein AAF485_07860 [Chloroflexota bacterium]